MDPIVEAGAAAVLAGYLVSFFKLAYAETPSWALVLTALMAGILSSVLVTFAGSEVVPVTSQLTARMVMQGIIAAAIAAGLTRTDRAGEQARTEAKADAEIAAHPTPAVRAGPPPIPAPPGYRAGNR